MENASKSRKNRNDNMPNEEKLKLKGETMEQGTTGRLKILAIIHGTRVLIGNYENNKRISKP